MLPLFPLYKSNMALSVLTMALKYVFYDFINSKFLVSVIAVKT